MSFIFYDDLVRSQAPRLKTGGGAIGRKPPRGLAAKAVKPGGDKKREAWDLVVKTYEALVEERGEGRRSGDP